MPNILSKIFSNAGGNLIKSIGDSLDKNITNKEEKIKALESISNTVMRSLNDLSKMQSEVIKQEVSGNWLQRSWRPILMLSFGFIIIYQYFISSVFGLAPINLPDKFWSLLEIGVGGYVIGRSAEKVSGQLGHVFKKKE